MDAVETQGHHRCGSLNLNVRGLGQSATLAVNERSNALRREGRHVRVRLARLVQPLLDVAHRVDVLDLALLAGRDDEAPCVVR